MSFCGPLVHQIRSKGDTLANPNSSLGAASKPVQSTSPPPAMGGRRSLILFVLTLLFVLVPFLFWRATWFGRPLSDREITRYLADDAKPRHIQHALSQVADRILRRPGPAEAREWYARVVVLSQHKLAEIRVMAAWVMGQDNASEDFHRALLELLQDPEPLVRRNAALSLVRFGDASGRPELVMMLRPYTMRSPREGTLSIRLKEGDAVSPGTLLARLDDGTAQALDLRSPLPGRVASELKKDGARVAPGDELVLLSPSHEQVWEALRALYLVGRPEDLPDVERFAGRNSTGGESQETEIPKEIRAQAALTAKAIRGRL